MTKRRVRKQMIKSLKILVELSGFEPLTSALRTQHSPLKSPDLRGFARLAFVIIGGVRRRLEPGRFNQHQGTLHALRVV